MTIGTVLAALFLAAGTASGLAAPAPDAPVPDASVTEPGHIVTPASNAEGVVTRQRFESRIAASAARLAMQSPAVKADRFAAYDVAWPRDAGEWDDLHGNAVLLTGALSQDASELPLVKVHLVRADGSEVVLRHLGSIRRRLSPSSQAGVIFGPNLEEDFYLLPVTDLGAGDTQLRCDFTRNRLGFVLANPLSPPQRSFAGQASTAPPPLAAVKALVTREYPDYGISLRDEGK